MSKTYMTFQTSKTLAEIPRKGTTLTIQPFGDVHRDSPNCDVDKWKRFLRHCKEHHNRHTYYLGMGDLMDFASFSERKVLSTVHESTLAKMDDVAMRDLEKFADEISFMKGNLLGLHHGNHEWKFRDGRLATEVLCEMLDCPFLGYAAYIRLVACCKGTTVALSTAIFSSHGKGGGQLLGSPYNAVEKMAKIFHDADIYLMGHDHHKGAVSRTTLYIDNHLNMGQKRQWFGRTGSFLKGWVNDEPSYCIGRLYSPTDLGTIKFAVTISRSKKHGIDRMCKDIHAWT